MASTDKILAGNDESIEACAQILRGQGLVAVPTETVYGLGGNALSETAVRKIFEVKGRPLIDPLISHFKDKQAAFQHVEASEVAEKMADAFWPGPLTLILPKKESIPDLVTAGLQTAAVRVPNHPLLQKLLQKLEFPLAAPSANPFSYVSPTKPEHVERTLGDRIDAILDGGNCRHGLESTVLDLRDPKKPIILRPGPIGTGEIKEKTGLDAEFLQKSNEANVPQTAPGLLSKHYSPTTEITILENGSVDIDNSDNEALILNKKPATTTTAGTYWLSEDGDIREIARNFFDLLQKLDAHDYERIFVEAAPELGIGIAFNDRLRRAAN